jgi:hypothetical protein
MSSFAQFAFILAVPLLVVAGALVTLFAVAALFDALENPTEVSARIDALFRRAPRAPKDTASDHYYQPHWKQKAASDTPS